MSEHSEVTERLAAYALHALDVAEAGRVEAHLEQCAACRAHLAELRETTSRLAGRGAGPPPSAGLRERVLRAVAHAAQAGPRAPQAAPGARQPRWAWACVAVALLASQGWLVTRVASLRAQLERQAQVEMVLLSSDEAPVRLEPADPASPAQGFYRYERDLDWGLLNYYRLPALGADQTYQCWMEFAAQAVQPCGRVPVDRSGSGLLVMQWNDQAPTRIRITREVAPGPTPTGPTVLSAEISADQP
jgi:hypothetical protein